jgi:hypothetical protein
MHPLSQFHRPLSAAARNGSCRSSVLNASVRGVYGCAGVACTAGNTRFISHSRSELSESGECFVCMSSMPYFPAARWAAVGMRDQIPRPRLRRKVALEGGKGLAHLSWYWVPGKEKRRGETYSMKTDTANAPFACKQYPWAEGGA